MKTLLNLLPEEKKEAVERRLHLRFLLWQLFLLFVLEVFYLGILVSTFLVLDYQLKGLNALGEASPVASVSDERRLGEYEQKFKETNTRVKVIGGIDRSHFHFTNAFTLLGPLLPPGVTVDRISTKGYRVSLTGQAAKREDLLLFDDNLKRSETCITEVDIPISNLFSQKDIEFQADFSITSECLKGL